MVAKVALMDSIAMLDDRMRALQASTAKDAAKATEQYDALARAVAEQARNHAVLAQWMQDWTSEVAAWRKCVDTRLGEADMHTDGIERELQQARGAMKVALWVFGTALTVLTGVFSGVMVRVLGAMVAPGGR
jgi:hypothetical protein